MRKHIVCLGDSNTYGYDPRSWLGGRYPADSRWVDILAAKTGWEILNLGQNGREIPRQAPTLPPDTDLLILMLGTNDLKPRFSLNAFDIAAGAERLIRIIRTHLPDGQKQPPRILLVCPPPIGDQVDSGAIGGMFTAAHSVAESRALPRYFAPLAQRYDCLYCQSGDYVTDISQVDSVHLTAEGHRALAEALADLIRREVDF